MPSQGRSDGSFRNEFSWSHSRQETFRECLKRYYYHYYGYWGGWNADADPLVRKLYVLRKLKNRYLWAGSAVHDAVAGILEKIRAGLTPPSGEEVAEAAVEQMRQDFRASRDGLYLERPARVVGLFEHHYRERIADEEWRSFADMVRRSILGFANGPFMEQVRALSADDWLTLEELLTFQIDGAKVYVKMDLAHRSSDGGAVIVDWKTGRRRPKPEGLQLGCYALYATEAWGVAPEQIQVIEANLSTGAVGTARITLSHLDKAREAIAAGIREMRAVLSDAENNVASETDFPASPSSRTCRRCPFREVCPAYRAMQDGAPAAAESKTQGQSPIGSEA